MGNKNSTIKGSHRWNLLVASRALSRQQRFIIKGSHRWNLLVASRALSRQQRFIFDETTTPPPQWLTHHHHHHENDVRPLVHACVSNDVHLVLGQTPGPTSLL